MSKWANCIHHRRNEDEGGYVCGINAHDRPSLGVCAHCEQAASDPAFVPRQSVQRRQPMPSAPVAVAAVPPEQWPLMARQLAKLAIPADTGLGDVVQRYAAKVGGERIKAAARAIGLNCGCGDRQRWLNKRYPLPGSGPASSDV